MTFYFNTPDQIAADKAYNRGNYKLALQHYEHALSTLNMHAASTLKLHTQFYDAHAHVLHDIIITHCELILHSEALDLPKIKTTWRQINSLLRELQQSCQHITHRRHRETTTAKVNQVYVVLAKTCESISDDIVDACDDEYEFKIIEQPQLADALMWMEKALNNQMASGQPSKLKFHLGYLHLLERQYKLTADTSFIEKMANYITAHNLVAEKIAASLRKLEFLGYILRIAITNNNDTEALRNDCQVILQTLNNEDKDSAIVEDVLGLLRTDNDDVQAMEIGCSGHVMSEDGQRVDDRAKEIITLDDLSSIPESLLVLEAIGQVNSEEYIECAARADSTVSTSLPPTSPATLLLRSLFSAGNVATTSASTHETNRYTKAFLTAFNEVTHRANNHRFLANLLSLTADFFRNYKVVGLKSGNCLIIANNLYQQALAIEPTTKAAVQRDEEIQRRHPRLFHDHKKFSQASMPTGLFSPVLCDPRRKHRIEEHKKRFNRTIKDMVMELEAYLSASPENFKATLDSLMQHLCQVITFKKIADTKSEPIAHVLFSTYVDMTATASNLEAPNCSQ